MMVCVSVGMPVCLSVKKMTLVNETKHGLAEAAASSGRIWNSEETIAQFRKRRIIKIIFVYFYYVRSL